MGAAASRARTPPPSPPPDRQVIIDFLRTVKPEHGAAGVGGVAGDVGGVARRGRRSVAERGSARYASRLDCIHCRWAPFAAPSKGTTIDSTIRVRL
jgi:hypothetical protein